MTVEEFYTLTFPTLHYDSSNFQKKNETHGDSNNPKLLTESK